MRILPIIEDITEVIVSEITIASVEIVRRIDRKEVVEVHLVDLIILRRREVQLIRHLVGEEIGVFTSIGIVHRGSRNAGSSEKEGEK